MFIVVFEKWESFNPLKKWVLSLRIMIFVNDDLEVGIGKVAWVNRLIKKEKLGKSENY